MGRNIKVNGLKIRKMALAPIIMEMGISMLDNGKMISNMGKVSYFMLMEGESMKVSS